MLKKFFWRVKAPSSTEQAAIFTVQIATFLRSGSNMTRALKLLSEENTMAGKIACEVLQDTERSSDIPLAIASREGDSWQLLGAVWHIALQSGAPVALTMEKFSQIFLNIENMVKKRRAITASPRATTVLISILPIGSVLISELLGFSLLKQFMNPLGFTMLSCGLTLLFLGIYWSLKMISKYSKNDYPFGLEFDLTRLALSGGKSVDSAVLLVVDTVDWLRVEWVPLNLFCRNAKLWQILRTALGTGAPVASLLEIQSRKLQDSHMVFLEEEAQKLGVKILIPLSVCVLPAFIFIGVLPMVLALMA